MNFFIFGAGYSARAFARSIAGSVGSIRGTTRSETKFDLLRRSGIDPLLFDGRSVSEELKAALLESTHLVISIAPAETGDPVLKLVPDLRQVMPTLEWIGYLSTVGVYGDHQGDWVDETSPCRPASARSVDRLAAEQTWTAAGEAAEVPLAILRLSGIYGPGRNAFVKLAGGTARRLVKPGQVFNRIHVADLAGALRLLAERKLSGIFNVSDDEPSAPQDVVAYAARLMGVEPPPEQDFESADLTALARSFYGENKRVSNAAIKKAGYRFLFPDYRTALDGMWRSGNWQATEDQPTRGPIRR